MQARFSDFVALGPDPTTRVGGTLATDIDRSAQANGRRAGLRTIPQLGVLMLAVVLLTAQGFLINRAAGIDYPLWAPRTGSRSSR